MIIGSHRHQSNDFHTCTAVPLPRRSSLCKCFVYVSLSLIHILMIEFQIVSLLTKFVLSKRFQKIFRPFFSQYHKKIFFLIRKFLSSFDFINSIIWNIHIKLFRWKILIIWKNDFNLHPFFSVRPLIYPRERLSFIDCAQSDANCYPTKFSSESTLVENLINHYKTKPWKPIDFRFHNTRILVN